jgi:hypothetical protein
MKRWLLCCSCWLQVACGATHGDVQHPEAGRKSTTEYCQKADAEEQNCMACTSKPGCGFCSGSPDAAGFCQPGVSGDDAPASCATPLVLSSAECPAPPPLPE